MDNSLPAFAAMASDMQDHIEYQPGLTKREYFAGIAMQSLLNQTDAERTISEGNSYMLLQIVAASVIAADALLTELNK